MSLILGDMAENWLHYALYSPFITCPLQFSPFQLKFHQQCNEHAIAYSVILIDIGQPYYLQT